MEPSEFKRRSLKELKALIKECELDNIQLKKRLAEEEEKLKLAEIKLKKLEEKTYDVPKENSLRNRLDNLKANKVFYSGDEYREKLKEIQDEIAYDLFYKDKADRSIMEQVNKIINPTDD